MEALLVLLGLAVLAMPIGVVVLFIQTAGLRRDLDRLRDRADRMEAALRGTPLPEMSAAEPAAALSAPEAAIAAETVATPAVAAANETVPAQATPWSQPNELPPAAPSGLTLTLARLTNWLRENWFYAIAAVSLALAGLFLVQYGVETGLLSPPLRVAAALAFGVALIAGGETIRRRSGDGAESTTAYLPSTLSSAGLVSLMGGILSARLLYDLIGPTPALIALFAIALVGLVLGWLSGPLLAAIGILGGMGAPFVVGGSSDSPEWLLLYFALLTGLGLGIDTLRRWAWVSVLSLVSGFLAASLLWISSGSQTMTFAIAAYGVALGIMAILIPARSLTPDQQGICLTQMLKAGKPAFPTLLAAGATLAACGTLLAAVEYMGTTWWAALALATGLGVALSVWSYRAPGLQDLAAIPAATVLLLLVSPELTFVLLEGLRDRLAETATQTETRMPLQVTFALLSPVLLTLAAAWRSLKGAPFAAHWAAAAALIAPVAGLAMEITWRPADLIGAWPWALHALALAGLMTALAARFARVYGEDRLRAALAVISALACLAFALSVILTEAALTLALAATVLAAAALDRRFDLAPMTGYIVAGILGLGYRLTVDPGLIWGVESPFAEVLVAYGGTLAALLAARWLLAVRDRPRARIFLESAAWSVGAMTVSLVLYHMVEKLTGHPSGSEHWTVGLHAAVWLAVSLAQLDRLQLGGRLKWLRIGLAAVFGLIALGLLAVGLTFANPLFEEQHISGVVLLNTLMPAYLAPALVLLAGALRLTHLPRLLRGVLAGLGAVLAAVWAALVIRHAWQGADGLETYDGITQPEMYSYTVALLLVGALLFLRALQRRDDLFRRAGIAVIGLAVAKVFLLDAAGLDGLARVFSFLLLGLSLAGLAWLNRWVQTRSRA